MRQLRNSSGLKGQILLLVFFLLLIATVLATGLSVIWESSAQVTALERNGILAFYLAQAGIEYGEMWVKYNAGTTTLSNISLGQGRYSFTVTNAGGNIRTIQATGEVLDAAGTVIAQKQIRVDVDRSVPSQQDNTWQEI